MRLCGIFAKKEHPMGFLDNLKQKFVEGRGKLTMEVSRFRNAAFLEGVVAGAVFISFADGAATSEEKKETL